MSRVVCGVCGVCVSGVLGEISRSFMFCIFMGMGFSPKGEQQSWCNIV